MDNLTPDQRRLNMTSIRSKNTTPELVVRALVHRMGFRYRLHASNLPGKPDIVLPRLSKVVFVHGCFWHVHKCPYGQVVPMTNTNYWQSKRLSNVKRGFAQTAALKKAGWQVLIIWECQTRNIGKLKTKLERFLGSLHPT